MENKSPRVLSKFITPLRLIFWGGLLCLFDFKFSQVSGREGFQVDVLSDLVGMILVVVGLSKIAMLPLPGRVAVGMKFLVGVGIVSALAAALDHFIFRRPDALVAMLQLLGLVELGSMMLFCGLMRSVCRDAGLSRPAGSWRTTLVLFGVIYVIPLGFLHGAVLVAMATRTEFRIDLGPAVLLLLPVFFWPLVHLFISTSRMARAAGASIGASSAAVVQ